MPVQSAIRSAVMPVTSVITVAAGAFAPGHLGELTRIVPFELADAVLAEEGGLEKRVRLLPSRVGLYFLLAMCLFPQPGYLGVWGKLTAGLRMLRLEAPSGKALRDLRRRIGIPPVRRLCEVLAGPQGQPRTPGIMFGGYRTVSLDGCKSIRVPDTAANRSWLGKQNASNGETGYPAISLMALVETGTRALLGAVFGPAAGGEAGQALRLLPLLDATMLLLTDRGFDAGGFLAAVAATRAQFLARLTSTRSLPVLRHLPDGSFLSVTGGVKVRIITAAVTVTCHDGTSYGGVYRLATIMASIIKRCDCPGWDDCPHPWVVRYRTQGGRASRQREQSFGDDLREAEDFLLKVEHDKKARVFIDPNAGRVTFRAEAEAWLSHHLGADSTIVGYRSVLRWHVYPAIGDRQIRTIRREDIKRSSPR